MRTVVVRLRGQASIGPTGVADQSKSRIRPPISPPVAKKLGVSDEARGTSPIFMTKL
jgi:hypothetical protein